MDNYHVDDSILTARIDLNDYFELRSWAKRFGVTAGDIRRAVAAVGDCASDVRAFLVRTNPAAAARLLEHERWPV